MLKLALALALATAAFAQGSYQIPPKELADLVDAPITPSVSADPSGSRLLIGEQAGYLTIADLSQPELKLAGMRFNPVTRTQGRATYAKALAIQDVKTKASRPITGLPADAHLRHSGWSPDGKHVAFTHQTTGTLELWVADVESAKARRVGDLVINNVRTVPYQWTPDSKALVVPLVVKGLEEPADERVPAGPEIQEATAGKKAPAPTFQDLLKDRHDDALFTYHTTVELHRVGLDGGPPVKVFGPAQVMSYEISPDGKFMLIETTRAPYSHIVPVVLFAVKTEVVDIDGKPVAQVADEPAAEALTPDRDSVQPGRREFAWRADAPATLVWVEAQDNGEPRREAPIRDKLFTMGAPFKEPRLFAELPLRFRNVNWGTDDLALVTESWYKTRKIRTYRVAPKAPGKLEVVFDRSSEDRYGNPGSPAIRVLPNGQHVLLTDGKVLWLAGDGASPEGDRPFLDRFDLASKKADRLWRSEKPYYERIVRVTDDGAAALTLRESVVEPRNVFRRVWGKEPEAITAFPHPAPQMKDVQKELIRYKRADGVDLTAVLYLPPGFKAGRDKPLPALLWAYPAEFKSAAAAGQVSDSPYRFVGPSIQGPIGFTLRGYCVLDHPTFPIVGEGKAEPNDTYVKQLTDGAQAAVDEIVRRGAADRDRIAMGGHSYGAFTTANLLAHTDLFRAGIARSGAYNRTLTPFGFQSEERSFWEARETYVEVSPFTYADKIDEPLLMIHGMEDANSGTFPIQSERLLAAIKGLGGTARLVMLPKESHGYAARESLKHMLWEMDRWLEKYVKNAGPRAKR